MKLFLWSSLGIVLVAEVVMFAPGMPSVVQNAIWEPYISLVNFFARFHRDPHGFSFGFALAAPLFLPIFYIILWGALIPIAVPIWTRCRRVLKLLGK